MNVLDHYVTKVIGNPYMKRLPINYGGASK